MLIQLGPTQSPRNPMPLGDVSLFGDFSLQTLALMGIGGLVVYQLLFGSGIRERRSKLRDLDREYAEKRRQVKKEYPRYRRGQIL